MMKILFAIITSSLMLVVNTCFALTIQAAATVGGSKKTVYDQDIASKTFPLTITIPGGGMMVSAGLQGNCKGGSGTLTFTLSSRDLSRFSAYTIRIGGQNWSTIPSSGSLFSLKNTNTTTVKVISSLCNDLIINIEGDLAD